MNIWDVMDPTNHQLLGVSPGLQQESMVEFSSVFIACCKLSTALICFVIDMSRWDSDRVSDLIEIKNALLGLIESNSKASSVGLWVMKYI